MQSPLARRKFSALDWLCLRLIAWYQRHVSPRKGYRCAHARLHGGDGCSGFARDAIATHGARAAVPQIKRRFGDCKRASRLLRAQVDLDKPTDERVAEAEKRERKKDSGCASNGFAAFDIAVCIPDGLCCAESACEAGTCADIGCAEAGCGCLSCW